MFSAFLLPVFDTTPPGLGGHTRPDLAVRSENLTPPRISPGCPHCVIPISSGLWLGRGTIMGRMRSWRECLPRHPLGWMGTARHLLCRFDKVSKGKGLFLLSRLLLLSCRWVLAHPGPVAFPFRAHPLLLSCCRLFGFQCAPPAGPGKKGILSLHLTTDIL